MRQAGAVHCETHTRWECSKKSKRRPGERCHALAIRGTNACKTHGGQRREVLKAKGEALSAWRAVPGRVDVSPAEAVMAMLQVSWARFHLYASLLERQLEDADPGTPGGVGQGEGLVGHTRSASPSVGVYESGEAIRGLALLEAQERDRCVRFAKTAHDMGIADREIRLAEAQGALLAGAISRILDALELSPGQRALVPTVVPRELLAIAGEAAR
ncbi:hypothetical protein [Nonomuraea guangzhouensis]|uniref:DUF222 domain-containing protein n=1 Tax=Nonomuraea guangzhouensis TaxID=1291555 RepID=A0ABW4GVT5_9ACTN|nr:hypothetical protein [Nonomuraea guangzhouensis]